MVQQQVDARINMLITNLGSKEKIEEYNYSTVISKISVDKDGVPTKKVEDTIDKKLNDANVTDEERAEIDAAVAEAQAIDRLTADAKDWKQHAPFRSSPTAVLMATTSHNTKPMTIVSLLAVRPATNDIKERNLLNEDSTPIHTTSFSIAWIVKTWDAIEVVWQMLLHKSRPRALLSLLHQTACSHLQKAAYGHNIYPMHNISK